MKIVSIANFIMLHPQHQKELKLYGSLHIYNDNPPRKMIYNRVRNAEIVIAFAMTRDVIDKAKKLRMICVLGTGYDKINIHEAKRRNITVCNCPEFSTEAVAEHTIGLIIAATRLLYQSSSELRGGQYNQIQYKGKELKGKTLGIVGYGNIGRRVAEIAKNGFSINILYINTSSKREDLERLLKKSDVIAITLPLTEKTHGMIGKKEFSLMKKGVIIVNTARGAVIDEEAFAENLGSGKIFAAGIDVLSKEPMETTGPLFKFPNVIITPHIGFNTDEAEFVLSQMVTKNIVRFIQGNPQNVVV